MLQFLRGFFGCLLLRSLSAITMFYHGACRRSSKPPGRLSPRGSHYRREASGLLLKGIRKVTLVSVRWFGYPYHNARAVDRIWNTGLRPVAFLTFTAYIQTLPAVDRFRPLTCLAALSGSTWVRCPIVSYQLVLNITYCPSVVKTPTTSTLERFSAFPDRFGPSFPSYGTWCTA